MGTPCRNLMAKQDMSELGFGRGHEVHASEEEHNSESIEKWTTESRVVTTVADWS